MIDVDLDLDGDLDEQPYVCWCGVELSDEDLEQMEAELDGPPCGGSGTLHCRCGGDFCCCHNHGEAECPGCEDCEGDDDYYDD